jgi:hypothetical protein
MKRPFKFAVALTSWLLGTLVVTFSASPADPAKVAGEWKLTVESPNITGAPTANFKQDGENLAGTFKGRLGEAPLQGTIKGNAIKFTVSMTSPNGDIQAEYSGTVDGDSMKGTVKFGDIGQGSFTGKRKGTDAPAPK